MAKVKRTIKDSIFTFLFRQPEYLRELYLTLHPEDVSVTEEDCRIVTIENILSTGMHNDLSFLVRGILIVLVEAQSTFAPNIALRLLLYLAKTYQEYVDEHELDLYSEKALSIPRVECYMVYTGARNTPDIIRLSDLCSGRSDVEVCVKVLRGDGSHSIIDQYARFCEISDEVRKKYGYTQEAIDEIFRKCAEEQILAAFLTSRRLEVRDIMFTLFDQEKVTRYHEAAIRKEAETVGEARGKEAGISAFISGLRKYSVAKDSIVSDLMHEFGLSKQEASEKLAQYWA